MNDKKSILEERIWEVGYDGHERAQARRLAAMTFRQKLEWLEEAHRLVLRLQGKSEPDSPEPRD